VDQLAGTAIRSRSGYFQEAWRDETGNRKVLDRSSFPSCTWERTCPEALLRKRCYRAETESLRQYNCQDRFIPKCNLGTRIINFECLRERSRIFRMDFARHGGARLGVGAIAAMSFFPCLVPSAISATSAVKNSPVRPGVSALSSRGSPRRRRYTSGSRVRPS